jgi:hypothetical protein
MRLHQRVFVLVSSVGIGVIACLSSSEEPEPTGIESLDGIIADVVAGDASAVAATVKYQQVPCVEIEQVGSPPPCPEGLAIGTELDVFPINICEGTWAGREELPGRLEAIVEDVELEAVKRSDENGADAYRPVFRKETYTFWLTVVGGRVVDFGGPCTPFDRAVLDAVPGEFIVTPTP